MNSIASESVRIVDRHPKTAVFMDDFCSGLRQNPKQVPPKYFYDAAGSWLFERVCETEEYFPARVEKRLLRRHLGEICRLIGPRCRMVEFGSGNSEKTRFLLNRLSIPAVYMPVDISREQLRVTAQELADAYPRLELIPVCADYTEPLELPEASRPFRRTVFFFPGSTIGNMHPTEARAFLRRVAAIAKAGDGFLIGFGLQTDPAVLERAYNDSAGITAAFNLNLLRRAREELGAEVDPEGFFHEAVYDSGRARIEMRLVSRREQIVTVNGEEFPFSEGEYIVTEYAYKFSEPGIRRIALQSGFRPVRSWSDRRHRMILYYFIRTETSAEADALPDLRVPSTARSRPVNQRSSA